MRWLPLVALIPACFNPNLGAQPFACGAGGECPSGYTCESDLCVRPGALVPDAGDSLADGDETPDAFAQPDAIQFTCEPNQTVCDGDELVTCDGSGVVASTVDCAVGCDPDQLACWSLTPSNIDSRVCDDSVTTDVDISDQATIDVDACRLTDAFSAIDVEGDIESQGGGGNQAICVIRVHDLTIEAGGELQAIAPFDQIGHNLVAIVATDTIDVEGTLDASAMGDVDGPGSTDGDSGEGITDTGSYAAGGGGAGFGTDGAPGGADDGGAFGGESHGVASLVPLEAGSRGGWSGDDGSGDDVSGGGGGGGMQIVACLTLIVGDGGVISSVGGGGDAMTFGAGGGGGGGSGGAILLEAPVLELPSGAALSANGGSGAGGSSDASSGEPGNDGSLGTTGAAGGGGAAGSASGGGGGAIAGPTKGNVPSVAGNGSDGGGGGAAGRIRINTRADVASAIDGTISPNPSMGSIARHH